MLLIHVDRIIVFTMLFAVLIAGNACANDCIIIETLRHHATTFFHDVKGDLQISGTYQGTYIPANRSHIKCAVDVWESTENIVTYGNYSCNFYVEKWRENETAAKYKFQKFFDAIRNCVTEPGSIEMREEKDDRLDIVTRSVHMRDGDDSYGSRHVDISYYFMSHYWVIRLQYTIEKDQ